LDYACQAFQAEQVCHITTKSAREILQKVIHANSRLSPKLDVGIWIPTCAGMTDFRLAL
jgi:hypothetical protein